APPPPLLSSPCPSPLRRGSEAWCALRTSLSTGHIECSLAEHRPRAAWTELTAASNVEARTTATSCGTGPLEQASFLVLEDGRKSERQP
ncbi:hypothetical protein EJB05_36124, partial [Eragrostis curvula]